ncbi:unnamed protein product [Aphanomyces euteiches]
MQPILEDSGRHPALLGAVILDFPMKIGSSFSDPSALAPRPNVMRLLSFLKPEFAIADMDFFGNARENSLKT